MYAAEIFLETLERHKGKETARRLLKSSGPQKGLLALQRLGLLDKSVEAVVLQGKYRSLFTEAELSEAHHRLEDLGYFKKAK